ncbi:hypothetical protein [Achromobacter xylosoxidans]|uniref:hypothetical protein n=1 Tax=Alcaligenes xylosoxydans xylosoxydans TaxID=85698 RepID=UPI001EED835F|nr:hypothetical protein [Achromobacter xylosoxidans]
MTAYYLLQHVLLTLGLALCGGIGARWFHVSMAPRMLLAAALTPQVIGVCVMALAMWECLRVVSMPICRLFLVWV